MIYPNSYRLLKSVYGSRTNAKIYLYNRSSCIYKGEIKNISPEKFEKLKYSLEELIQINNSEGSFRLGIIEVQQLIEGFK